MINTCPACRQGYTTSAGCSNPNCSTHPGYGTGTILSTPHTRAMEEIQRKEKERQSENVRLKEWLKEAGENDSYTPEQKTCETCKFFHKDMYSGIYCKTQKMEQTTVYSPAKFQIPNPDFGCNFWEAKE
jgi:hypothetical protein